MNRISLKDNFISVCRDGMMNSFGGSQEWFSSPEWGNISRQGCGVISAVDTMLYLLGKNDTTDETYRDTVGRFCRENKLANLFMKEITIRKYDNSFAVGVLPNQIARFLNREMKSVGSDRRFKWNGICGHKNMYQKMKNMLSNDIPIVWSLYSRKKQINLYQLTGSRDEYVINGVVNNHYVTVTGIYEGGTGESKHPRMIEVSSWGKCYYIDYDEYLAYVGTSLISRYCSNILYCKNKGMNKC